MQEMQETQIQPLGQEDPLEEERATHSSILAWKIPWTGEPGGLHTVQGVAVGHDRACTHMHTYRHCSTNWLILELLAWLCQGWLPGSADVAPSPPEGQHVSWSPWKPGGQKGVLPKARAPHGSGSLRLNSVWGAFVLYFFSGLTYPGKDLGQSTVVSLWTQERETTRLRKELGILNLGFLRNCNKGSFCSISWCRRRLTHTSCHWTHNTLFVDLPWNKDQALVKFFLLIKMLNWMPYLCLEVRGGQLHFPSETQELRSEVSFQRLCLPLLPVGFPRNRFPDKDSSAGQLLVSDRRRYC